MTLRKIIDWSIQDAKSSLTGNIASDFYESYDANGNWVWACDVDIGEEEVLTCVPVASNNREIIYSEQGKAVNLTKLGSGSYQITGLSKVQNSTTHYIYLTFTDDTYEITRDELKGYVYRILTYGELGTLVSPYGYGVLPYGARGKFKADGTFVSIVERS
jgi:hypothetical protein